MPLRGSQLRLGKSETVLDSLLLSKGDKVARTHGSKEIKELFRELKRLGFSIEQRGNAFVITPPLQIGGQRYTTHGTPKAIKAIYADFRRLYGLELDPKNPNGKGKTKKKTDK